MSSFHNTLRYGELAKVGDMVDAHQLNEDEMRAVILNLLDRLARVEKEWDNRNGT